MLHLPVKEIPILVYHRVSDEPSKYKINLPRKKFAEQMKFLYQKGYQTISLDLLAKKIKEALILPPKCIVLTFDDGYRDVYDYAFPSLKKYNFTATIFLVSDYLGRKSFWDEESAEILTEEEIIEMSRDGISFGVHSCTHPHLPELTIEKIKNEIFNSKAKIETIIKKPVTTFCYPYGEFDERVLEIVKMANFTCACATDEGACSPEEDLYRIRRIVIFPKTSKFGFWKKTSGWYSWYKGK